MTYGDGSKQTPNLKILIRIFSKLTFGDEFNGTPCWITHYRPDPSTGYVKMHFNDRPYYGHRLMYQFFVDAIPKGMECDHLCRVRHCVNPVHIEVVTPKVNRLRGISPMAVEAKKTHCIRGHELPPCNPQDGRRRCVPCERAYKAKFRNENRERLRREAREYYRRKRQTAQ